MALTPEVIKANEALASLPDEQVAIIATLSKNDEDAVISTKVGELHGGYDKDIFEVSGVKKKEGEKSYDYAKRVLGDFKTKAESASTLSAEIDSYKTTIKDLNQKIKDGNTDPVLKQKLADTESALAAIQTQYDTDKSIWEKEKGEITSQITMTKINSQFDKAVAGLKFKPEYPESVQTTLRKSAESNIMTKYKPDWLDDSTLVFRDPKTNEIVRNPANQQNPFTAQELLAAELKDVLDAGKPGKGGGTNEPNPGGTEVTLTDLAGVKTQVEADEIIQTYLMKTKGLVRGTPEFAEQWNTLRKENKVLDLPIR